MTHDEMIAIIQAAKEGKEIEVQYAPSAWGLCHGISFNFVNYSYRIKPQPLRGEGWMRDDTGMNVKVISDTKVFCNVEYIRVRWEQIMEDEA